jgi:RNA polymerase sigma-70 factor, ECF subfamily
MDAQAEVIPWGRALSQSAERAAVRGALRGDPAALAVLFRAYWPSAYRSAWLIVRDDHAAEDLAQEGFVAAFGALDRFDRSRPFGPWLRTIVARRAIDATRAKAARREVDGSAALALVAAPAPAVAHVAPDIEVLDAVAALPDEQRAVVVLRHLLELTPSEIAAVVGVPTGTVNSRLRRGLDALAKALMVALVVAVALGAALTQPGRATAEWVREHLSKVTGQGPPVTPRPVGSYGTLPGGGRLLAVTDRGPIVFGIAGAPRQLLGQVDAAAWSPHGRFVAAVRGIELIAVDLRGQRRWHVAARREISAPAWSPSGFRVAYLAGRPGAGGRTLRVVAGDGTADRVVAAAGPTPPAWRPGARHVLAHADVAGRLVVRDLDGGAVLWRVRAAHTPKALAWTPDGRRLLALDATGVTTYSRSGHRLDRATAPPGTDNVALALRTSVTGSGPAYGYAVVRRVRRTGDHRVALGAPGRQERLVLAGTGTVRAADWSPDGRWLALDRVGAAAWTLLRVDPARGVLETRTLAAGRGARLSGWCCG